MTYKPKDLARLITKLKERKSDILLDFSENRSRFFKGDEVRTVRYPSGYCTDINLELEHQTLKVHTKKSTVYISGDGKFCIVTPYSKYTPNLNFMIDKDEYFNLSLVDDTYGISYETLSDMRSLYDDFMKVIGN